MRIGFTHEWWFAVMVFLLLLIALYIVDTLQAL